VAPAASRRSCPSRLLPPGRRRPRRPDSARAHALLSSTETRRERGGTHDKDGFVLSAHPGKSQGRPRTTSSSQLISQNGLPIRVSQQKPHIPGARCSRRGRTQFHPEITAPPTSPRSTRSPAAASASGTCAPAPTGRKQKEKQSASSAPCSTDGPTARSTDQASNEPGPLTAGSGTTPSRGCLHPARISRAPRPAVALGRRRVAQARPGSAHGHLGIQRLDVCEPRLAEPAADLGVRVLRLIPR
jgi:hypothetical protein